MRYRIDYANGRRSSFVTGAKNLIIMLKQMERRAVSDVRKVYKSGVTDSVMETYEKYLSGGRL